MSANAGVRSEPPPQVQARIYQRLLVLNQPPASLRPICVLMPAILVGACMIAVALFLQGGSDARTYLAAGERLNAAHNLYALGPGDRPVALLPPYWTVPLMSPPLIAVIWRPLAALPSSIGLLIWWAGLVVSMVASLFVLLRRGGLFASFIVSILALPIGAELAAGNINGYLLAGFVLVWIWRREAWAGVLIALMSAVKLLPAVLIAWLLGSRARRPLVGLIVATPIWLALSLAGAGLDAHLRYIQIARTAYPAELSLPALTGIPSSSVVFLILSAVLCLIVSSRHPGIGFGIAIAAIVLGSPVVNITTYSLLAAIAAPVAFPATARPTLSAEGKRAVASG